jgi:hypothetical protein
MIDASGSLLLDMVMDLQVLKNAMIFLIAKDVLAYQESLLCMELGATTTQKKRSEGISLFVIIQGR